MTKVINYGQCHCGCQNFTAIAKQTDKKKGHVKGEPKKYIQGHSERSSDYHDPILERMKKRFIKRENGCWEWIGTKSQCGYGVISVGGIKVFAHRLMYTLFNGIIPDGIFVCHKCDNPSCCRWDHLFLGTVQENSRDMVNKNRQAKGENIGSAKLTEHDVLNIRQDTRPTKEIAAEYNIDSAYVCRLKKRCKWRHLDGPPSSFINYGVGEKHGMAKLQESDILKIRNDNRTLQEIAKDYDVTKTTICNVKNRRTWKNIK